MARFDVFDAPDSAGYVVDVQTDLIDVARTRVVVPLLPASRTPAPIKRLHPSFVIAGESFVMATHLIATLPVELLQTSRTSLADRRDEITAALDMLFQGF